MARLPMKPNEREDRARGYGMAFCLCNHGLDALSVFGLSPPCRSSTPPRRRARS
jgi:hypothetical protein